MNQKDFMDDLRQIIESEIRYLWEVRIRDVDPHCLLNEHNIEDELSDVFFLTGENPRGYSVTYVIANLLPKAVEIHVDRLFKTAEIHARLLAIMPKDHRDKWINAEHPELGNCRPYYAMCNGDFAPVEALVAKMEAAHKADKPNLKILGIGI